MIYLESMKGTELSELKKYLISLKDQYKTKIIQSRSDKKITWFKARALVRMIKICPCFTEHLYVFRENIINRKGV